MISRTEAQKILDKWVPNKNLQKHMWAVEAALRFYAKQEGADPEVWGLAGLLHDADWETFPDQHPRKIVAYLEEKNEQQSGFVPPEVIQAIASHGDNKPGENRFTERHSKLDHYLFAVDELSGFIVACALVRPDKLTGLKVSSVRKKLKDKSFAKGVNRDDILQSVVAIDRPLTDHIDNTIAALQSIQDKLEL